MKNASYLAMFIVSVEWLGFNPQILSLFIALMMIDVITGVARSFINEGGQSVRSRTAIKGIVSKMMLLFALFGVAITGQIIGFNTENYVHGAISVLALGELYSILGNIHSIRTGKAKSEFDAVALLLRKVRDMLNKALD